MHNKEEPHPFAILWFVVHLCNMAFLPIMRSNFGFRHFHTIETVGVFAPLLFAAFSCKNDAQTEPFVLHFLLLLIATPYRRIQAWWNRYGKNAPHTYSSGDSFFSRFGASHVWAIALWEPLLLFVSGILWIGFYEAYGMYLFYSAALLFGEAMFLIHLRDRHVFDMQDSIVDQEAMANDFENIEKRRMR
jgi:hypothetical protein